MQRSKNLSQNDVAMLLNTYHSLMDWYERVEDKPSLEAAAPLADALEGSLGYVVSTIDLLLEKNILKRIAVRFSSLHTCN